MRTPLPTIENCDDCGACCTEQAYLPIHMINPMSGCRSVKPLTEELERELTELTHRLKTGELDEHREECIWLDPVTRRCRNYEYRPELCRDALQPGDETCRRWRRLKGIDPTTRYKIKSGKLVKTQSKKGARS